MKKFLAIFLMVTYMASAIGLSFSFHYCGGHFKHISFSSDTEKGCCGKNEHKSHCCKDNVVKAKFKDDHSYSVKVVLNGRFIPVFPPFYKVWDAKTIVVPLENAFVANDTSPPFQRNVPIYLANRVLRI